MGKSKKKSQKKQKKSSPGPTSQSGKETVSFNAIKHGGNSPRLLPWEDPKEYAAFRAKQWGTLAPANGMEEVLAEEIVFDGWRLERLKRFELRLEQHLPEDWDDARWMDEFRKLTNLRNRIERMRDRKWAELEAMQDERMRAASQEMTVPEYRQQRIIRNLIVPVTRHPVYTQPDEAALPSQYPPPTSNMVEPAETPGLSPPASL